MALGRSRLSLLFYVTWIGYAVSAVDTASNGESSVTTSAPAATRPVVVVEGTTIAVEWNRRKSALGENDPSVPQGSRLQKRGKPYGLPQTVAFNRDATPHRGVLQTSGVLVKYLETKPEAPDPAVEDPGGRSWLEPPDVGDNPLRVRGSGSHSTYFGTFVDPVFKDFSATLEHKGFPPVNKGSSAVAEHKGHSTFEGDKGLTVLEEDKGSSSIEEHSSVVTSKTLVQKNYQSLNKDGQVLPELEYQGSYGNTEVHQVPKVNKGHATLHDDSEDGRDSEDDLQRMGLHTATTTTNFGVISSEEKNLVGNGADVDRVYTIDSPEYGPPRRWIAYFHEQVIAIILQEDDGTIINCTLREVITVGEQRASLAELGLALPLIPVSFHHMVHLVTLCGALDQIPEEDNALGASSAGSAWWMFFGHNILAGILPGTLWCGMGDQARNYHQLGANRRLDRCCRAHDHCPMKVRPHTRRYGVTNNGWNTKSHCACDLEFHRCLKESRTEMADTVGRVYFNLLRVRCLQEVSEPYQPPSAYSGASVDYGTGKSLVKPGPVEAQEPPPLDPVGQQQTTWNLPWQRRLECARWDRDHLCRMWLTNPRGNTVRLVLVPPPLEY